MKKSNIYEKKNDFLKISMSVHSLDNSTNCLLDDDNHMCCIFRIYKTLDDHIDVQEWSTWKFQIKKKLKLQKFHFFFHGNWITTFENSHMIQDAKCISWLAFYLANSKEGGETLSPLKLQVVMTHDYQWGKALPPLKLTK